MDPNFNGVWSASEIAMVKSFIASHNTNTTYTNMKHNIDIIDALQARFPGKDMHQVIQLYVHLASEMNTTQSNNQQIVVNNALVNDKFGIPTEDINMENIDMFHGHILDDVEAMKMVEEPLHKLNTVAKKKKQHPATAWTQDEHKNFLRGLEACGRGSWKSISRYFVPTKTPIQICSHAQKYFQRKECTTRKQRFSINDVGLYDKEPWVQKSSSSSKALAFDRNSYNTNYYGFEGQHTVFNKLTHASQASSGHVGTWTTMGQHTIESSFIDPTMVQSNSLGWEALAFTNGANNTNYYDFDGKHDAMNNFACADRMSNNQVPTWTSGQWTTSSSVPPTMVQNTSPSSEVLSFADSYYNTNYYDFDGQQVGLNNITRRQPW